MIYRTISAGLFGVIAGPGSAGSFDIATVSAVLEAGDEQADPGDRVTVESSFYNGGTEELDDIPIGYFLSADQELDGSDILLDTDEVDIDEFEFEDESEQIPLPGSASPGDQFLLVAADFNNFLAEFDETNNVVAIPILINGTVVTSSDIQTVSAELEPGDETVEPGERVTMAANFFNGGTEELDDVDIGYFLSRDQQFDGSDVLLDADEVDIDPGETEDESEEMLIPQSTPGGSQFILVVADFNGTLAESNETNNVVAVPIDVVRTGVTAYGENVGGANIGTLSALTAAVPGQLFTVEVTDIPSGGPGFVWASMQESTELRFGGTFLADFNSSVILQSISLASGRAETTFNLPPGFSGTTLYMQAASRDMSQPDGIAFTNGLEIVLP